MPVLRKKGGSELRKRYEQKQCATIGLVERRGQDEVCLCIIQVSKAQIPRFDEALGGYERVENSVLYTWPPSDFDKLGKKIIAEDVDGTVFEDSRKSYRKIMESINSQKK